MQEFRKLLSLNLDEREINLPETTYSRDIEDGVFQSIVQNCIASIAGVALVEGKFMSSLFGRETTDKRSAISIEQNSKNHSVSVKISLSIEYGLSIPQKSEEIQEAIVRDIINHTGLHVSSVHVVFRNLTTQNRN